MKENESEEMPKSAGMRALQILQTVMLTAMLGIGGFLGSVIMADHRLLASMEERQRAESADIALLHSHQEKADDKLEGLDHRVTIIETRAK